MVLGAYVQLGRCLDLTDTWATDLLRLRYKELRETFAATGRRLPGNESPRGVRGPWLFRRRDCAVINWCASSGEETPGASHSGAFDTVRGAFEEGPPAFAGAAVRRKSHVQIAVRNPACILGLFRPTGYTF